MNKYQELEKKFDTLRTNIKDYVNKKIIQDGDAYDNLVKHYNEIKMIVKNSKLGSSVDLITQIKVSFDDLVRNIEYEKKETLNNKKTKLQIMKIKLMYEHQQTRLTRLIPNLMRSSSSFIPFKTHGECKIELEKLEKLTTDVDKDQTELNSLITKLETDAKILGQNNKFRDLSDCRKYDENQEKRSNSRRKACLKLATEEASGGEEWLGRATINDWQADEYNKRWSRGSQRTGGTGGKKIKKTQKRNNHSTTKKVQKQRKQQRKQQRRQRGTRKQRKQQRQQRKQQRKSYTRKRRN